MVFESKMYGDPAKFYEFKERETCKGCRNEGWVEVGEKRVNICKLNKKYGRRCKNYEANE